MGIAIELERMDSRHSPRQRCTTERVPPVVGAGKPVTAKKIAGGTLPCASQYPFQMQYPAKLTMAATRRNRRTRRRT